MKKTEMLLKSLTKRNVQFPCHSRRRCLFARARQSDAKKAENGPFNCLKFRFLINNTAGYASYFCFVLFFFLSLDIDYSSYCRFLPSFCPEMSAEGIKRVKVTF